MVPEGKRQPSFSVEPFDRPIDFRRVRIPVEQVPDERKMGVGGESIDEFFEDPRSMEIPYVYDPLLGRRIGGQMARIDCFHILA